MKQRSPEEITDALIETALDIVRRINEAADQLFEESGQSTFPNVTWYAAARGPI